MELDGTELLMIDSVIANIEHKTMFKQIYLHLKIMFDPLVTIIKLNE